MNYVVEATPVWMQSIVNTDALLKAAMDAAKASPTQSVTVSGGVIQLPATPVATPALTPAQFITAITQAVTPVCVASATPSGSISPAVSAALNAVNAVVSIPTPTPAVSTAPTQTPALVLSGLQPLVSPGATSGWNPAVSTMIQAGGVASEPATFSPSPAAPTSLAQSILNAITPAGQVLGGTAVTVSGCPVSYVGQAPFASVVTSTITGGVVTSLPNVISTLTAEGTQNYSVQGDVTQAAQTLQQQLASATTGGQNWGMLALLAAGLLILSGELGS